MSNLPAGNRGRKPIRLTEAERRKRTRKFKRRDIGTTIAAGGLVVVGAVALVAAIFGIGALVFYAAWNLGVVPIVAAAGGSVSHIGFWTALGGSLAVGILRRVIGGPAAKVEATK